MPSDPPDLARGSRVPRLVQLPGNLEIQPDLRIEAEHLLQAQRSIGGNAALALHNLVQARVRHANPVRELRLRL